MIQTEPRPAEIAIEIPPEYDPRQIDGPHKQRQRLGQLSSTQRAALVLERYPELRALPNCNWERLSAWAVFGILFVASVVTVTRNLNSVTPILEMPFWLFFAPLVVGSALLVMETLAMLAHTWRRRRPEAKQTVLT